MGVFEDEDGIDGPFNRAMDRAIRDDDAARSQVSTAKPWREDWCGTCDERMSYRKAPASGPRMMYCPNTRCGAYLVDEEVR